jgi:hypothetical protein
MMIDLMITTGRGKRMSSAARKREYSFPTVAQMAIRRRSPPRLKNELSNIGSGTASQEPFSGQLA